MNGFLTELESHWILLSGVGAYTYLVLRVAFGVGSKAKDLVTVTYLTKHCEDAMNECRKDIIPGLEQAKKDSIDMHDLMNVVKETRATLEETIRYRKQILRGVGLINRQTIRLRSSISNTHMILGFIADRLWDDDEKNKKIIKGILKKEQEENAKYLGDMERGVEDA